jgi:hypothetical protein
MEQQVKWPDLHLAQALTEANTIGNFLYADNSVAKILFCPRTF